MGCWHTKIKHTKIFQQRIFTTRLFFYSYTTGCEKEQELLASRLCKCLLAPGYHAVYCTSLHKKSEQSFFTRVKSDDRRRLLSLVSIRRVVGIPVALQHLSNMPMCCGDREYMIPFDLPTATVLVCVVLL